MAQLCQHADEFVAANTQVLTVTFGTPEQARLWLQETSSPFPMLVDQEREAYRAFSLDRSFVRSWNVRTVLHYARLLLSGRAWQGIRGDSSQLGGDVIVDRHGIVRLVHRSRDPVDRPSVPALLQLLRDLA